MYQNTKVYRMYQNTQVHRMYQNDSWEGYDIIIRINSFLMAESDVLTHFVLAHKGLITVFQHCEGQRVKNISVSNNWLHYPDLIYFRGATCSGITALFCMGKGKQKYLLTFQVSSYCCSLGCVVIARWRRGGKRVLGISFAVNQDAPRSRKCLGVSTRTWSHFLPGNRNSTRCKFAVMFF